MKTLPLWAGLLCLAACTPPTEDTDLDSSDVDTSVDTEADSDSDNDTADDDTSDVDEDCSWTVDDLRSILPSDGADNVWISPTFDTVTARLWNIESPVASVQMVDGTDVAGSSSISDDVLTWTPTNGTLASDTEFEFIVTSDNCSRVVSTFTTVSDADVSFDPASVFVIDLSDVRGEGALVFGLFEDVEIGLWPELSDEFQFVPMLDGAQDECMTTTSTLTFYDRPELELYHVTAPIGEADAPVYFVNTDIRGVTDGAGDSLVSVRMTGHLDLTGLTDSDIDDFDFCDVASNVGLECVPCPDDATLDCIPFDLYNITAPAQNIAVRDIDEIDAFECGDGDMYE